MTFYDGQKMKSTRTPTFQDLLSDFDALRSAIRSGSPADELLNIFVDTRLHHSILSRFADVLSQEPDMCGAEQLLRAHAALRQHNYSNAILAFNEASNSLLFGARDRLGLAEAHRAIGDHTAATMLLETNERVGPYQQEFAFWSAVSEMELGKYDRALEMILAACQHGPHRSAEWLRDYLAISLKRRTDFQAEGSALADRYRQFDLDQAGSIFALIDYKSPDLASTSCNIGDYIQSLAIIGQLARYWTKTWTFSDPRLEAVFYPMQRAWPGAHQHKMSRHVHVTVIDRDTTWPAATLWKDQTVWTILHGWYFQRGFGCSSPFPLPRNLEPIFISFHLHDPQLLDARAIATLRQYEPIGCRDWSTVYWLLNLGVAAFFSGCVTSTISIHPRAISTSDYQLYVDAVPPAKSEALRLSHEVDKIRDTDFFGNSQHALHLLHLYSRARVVTTSRLHCYLPCRALETPVAFVPHNAANRRFDGLMGLSASEFDQMRRRLTGHLGSVLPMIFGGSPAFDIRERWRQVTSPCVAEARRHLDASLKIACHKSVIADQAKSGSPCLPRPAPVTVVLAFDGAIVDHALPLIKSLRANTSGSTSFIFLVRQINESALEAPLRLAGETTRVIQMDSFLKGTFVRLSRDTSLSTMDRLFLPRILPEHDRVVYLDTDAIVLGDIVELANFSPSNRGIAARPNPAPQSALQVNSIELAARSLNGELARSLRRLAAASVNLFRPSFNAGVLVLSLDRLRELHFTETCLEIVERFGLQDEQVLNIYSQGDFTTLPAEWNMMPYYDFHIDAKLIHWAGSNKPWLARPIRFKDLWQEYGGVQNVSEEAEAAGYWGFREHYSYSWEDRARVVAELISPGSSVLDLGCGRMALRKFLPAGCRYVPADLPRWNKEVIVVDLEAGEFPDGAFDVIVVLNVLEYLTDPLRVIRRSLDHGRYLIVSYSHPGPEASAAQRRECLWINDLSETDINSEFSAIGWELQSSHIYTDTPAVRQIIYVLARSTAAIRKDYLF